MQKCGNHRIEICRIFIGQNGTISWNKRLPHDHTYFRIISKHKCYWTTHTYILNSKQHDSGSEVGNSYSGPIFTSGLLREGKHDALTQRTKNSFFDFHSSCNFLHRHVTSRSYLYRFILHLFLPINYSISVQHHQCQSSFL